MDGSDELFWFRLVGTESLREISHQDETDGKEHSGFVSCEV